MATNRSVIFGVARDPTGQPVANARVYFISGPAPLPEIAALTDSSGKFSLTAPAAGVYQIECAADGFASATATVNVKSGQDAQVEMRLKRSS